jgi:hypothetical protein
MSKARECDRNSNVLTKLVVNGVKSLRKEKAYHYGEGRKLIKNFLWNLKIN